MHHGPQGASFIPGSPEVISGDSLWRGLVPRGRISNLGDLSIASLVTHHPRHQSNTSGHIPSSGCALACR